MIRVDRAVFTYFTGNDIFGSMSEMKKLLVYIVFQCICIWGFPQGSTDTIRGTLSFNFLGYPTLYKIDSLQQCDMIGKLEKKRLFGKDKWLKEYQLVYKMLKREGKEGYPCVEVFSEQKYRTLYLPVEAYHRIIEKNSKELEESQQQVVFHFSAHRIQGGYYVLDSLFSVEFQHAPGIRYGDKFAMTEYNW